MPAAGILKPRERGLKDRQDSMVVGLQDSDVGFASAGPAYDSSDIEHLQDDGWRSNPIAFAKLAVRLKSIAENFAAAAASRTRSALSPKRAA